MSYLQKAQELQAMIGQGKAMEALDKFYHDDVVVVDGNRPPRNGKAEQKAAVQSWYEMIQETHGGGVGALLADEENGITTAESWVEVTMKDGNQMKMEEVAVQKWKGDKIIHERFYYTLPE